MSDYDEKKMERWFWRWFLGFTIPLFAVFVLFSIWFWAR